jgi:hypothetical protein
LDDFFACFLAFPEAVTWCLVIGRPDLTISLCPCSAFAASVFLAREKVLAFLLSEEALCRSCAVPVPLDIGRPGLTVIALDTF